MFRKEEICVGFVSVLLLGLTACAPAATPTTNVPLSPRATSMPTTAPTILPMLTLTPVSLPPTSTPDVCAGATDAGARQRFTFEQIVPCLNTVAKVSTFMANNIKRDDAWDSKTCGEICYSPAWLVYQNGVDSLHDLITLERYFLEKNGWEAYHVGLSIELPSGTNLCGVNTNGAVLVLDYDGKTVGTLIP